jgi:chemotaxis protein methyltransferase CheR
MTLLQEEFQLLRDLVYQGTGLMFDERKLTYMETRVAKRMPAVNCENASDYYRHLRYRDPKRSELQAFVELLTTNETYFFRDFPQLEGFANEVLPRVAAKKRNAKDYTLNIWSAACSTGDEAYTLAIILHACLDDFKQWHIGLHATDIDSEVLATACRGVYSERAVKDVPPGYLKRYFTQHGDEYLVCDQIRDMVKLTQVNLVDRQAMRKYQGMDVIFCRNALIYFDDRSRRQVLNSFYDSLLPGGFIFLGHSESVGRISAAFEPVKFGSTIVYQKPAGRAPLVQA